MRNLQRHDNLYRMLPRETELPAAYQGVACLADIYLCEDEVFRLQGPSNFGNPNPL